MYIDDDLKLIEVVEIKAGDCLQDTGRMPSARLNPVQFATITFRSPYDISSLQNGH